MSAIADSHFTPPPQTGRFAQSAPATEPKNLWQQLLATVNEVGNAVDPFASDADSNVRALGRLARHHHPRNPDDYFALGDLCVRLSFDGAHLKQSYAEKAMLAYSRAGECSSTDDGVARRANLAFVLWVAATARTIGSYDALQVATAICERAVRLEVVPSDSAPAENLREMIKQIRNQMNQMIEAIEQSTNNTDHTPQRISRRLCDEGQVSLRHQRTAEALSAFARSIEADPSNSTAWLWQALTLTDVARFDEALASYDRAIELEPTNYGALNSKGALLLDLGRAAVALECFERALEMPEPPPVVRAAFLLNQGKALYILGRYGEARDALALSDQIDPTAESRAGIEACNEMLTRNSS